MAANPSRVAVDREEVIMAVVTDGLGEAEIVDASLVGRGRLEAFGVEVLAGAMSRPVQVRNGGLCLRGLIEQGARKSLEPRSSVLVGMLTTSRCSSSWPTVRGIRRWWSKRSLSVS